MKSKEKSTLLYVIRHKGNCTESEGDIAFMHCIYDECPLYNYIGCSPTIKFKDADINEIRSNYAARLFITEYGTKEELVEILL